MVNTPTNQNPSEQRKKKSDDDKDKDVPPDAAADAAAEIASKAAEPEWRRKLRRTLYPWTNTSAPLGITELGAYEYIMLFIYVLNMVLLMLSNGSDISNATDTGKLLKGFELFFTLLYIGEIVLLNTILGWTTVLSAARLIDAVLVVANLVIVVLYMAGVSQSDTGFSFLSIRCCLRLLRPFLRSTTFPAVRVFVVSVAQSIVQLGDVVVLYLLFMLWFGVAGVSQFRGTANHQCVNQFWQAASDGASLQPNWFAAQSAASSVQPTSNLTHLPICVANNSDTFLVSSDLYIGIRTSLPPDVLCIVDNNYTISEINRAMTSFANSFAAKHALGAADFMCGSEYVGGGQFLEDLGDDLLTVVNTSETDNTTATLSWDPPMPSTYIYQIIIRAFKTDDSGSCNPQQACNPDTEADFMGIRGYVCPYGYDCNDYADYSQFDGMLGFNNIGQSLLTLFVCTTYDEWPTILYVAVGGTSYWGEVYFIVFLIAGTFMLVNLTDVVLSLEYDTSKSEERRRIKALLSGEKTVVKTPGSSSVFLGIAGSKFTDVVRKAIFERQTESLAKARAHNLSLKQQRAAFLAIVLKNKERKKQQELEDAQREANEKRQRRKTMMNGSFYSAPSAGSPMSPASFTGNPFNGREPTNSSIAGDTTLLTIDTEHSMSSSGRKNKKQTSDESAEFVLEDPDDPISFEDFMEEDDDGNDWKRIVFKMEEARFLSACRKADAEGNGDGTKIKLLRLHFKTRWYVVESRWFSFLTSLVTLANICLLATDYYGISDGHANAIWILNGAFSAFYVIELIIRMLGKRLSDWFTSFPSYIDMAVVVCCIVDILPFANEINTTVRGIRVVRTFRAFRFIKMFPKVYEWFRYILSAIAASPMVLLILLQLMFIFSAFGVQAFGDKFCGTDDEVISNVVSVEYLNQTSGDMITFTKVQPAYVCAGLPRAHFEHFGYALLTSFQVLTYDNWVDVLIVSMTQLNVAVALAYVIYLFIGNHIILSLLVAILLSAGETDGDQDESLEELLKEDQERQMKKQLEEKAARDADDMEFVRKKNEDDEEEDSEMDSVASDEEDEKHTQKSQEKRKYIVLKSGRVKKVSKAGQLIDKFFTLVDRSRIYIKILIESLPYKIFMSLIIILGTVVLALYEPLRAPDTQATKTLHIINLVTTGFYVAEVILCTHVYGFIKRPTSYLRRDIYNILDFLVVIINIVTIIGYYTTQNQSMEAIGGVAALRPIRLAKESQGVRLVIGALLGAIPRTKNILWCAIGLFLVYGILGVSLFGGRQRVCVLPDATTVPQLTLTECHMVGGRYMNTGAHFDHIGASLISLFQMATMEGWSQIMYSLTDIVGLDQGMERDANLWAILYCVLFTAFMGIFMSNVIAATIIDAYNSQKRKAAFQKSVYVTREQTAWLTTNQRIARFLPVDSGAISQETEKKIRHQKRSALKALGGSPSGGATNTSLAGYPSPNSLEEPLIPHGSTAIDMDEGSSSSEDEEKKRRKNGKRARLKQQSNKLRDEVRKFVRKGFFANLCTFIVLCNFVAMAVLHYPMDETFQNTENSLYFFFAAWYAFEALVKIVGEGWRQYFSSQWSRLEFFIAIISIIAVATSSGADESSPFAAVVAMSVLRLGKLTRGRLKIEALIGKLGLAAFSLLNVFAVGFIILFVFGVVGMRIFGRVKYEPFGAGGGIDTYCNFMTIHSSLMLMFQLMTAENWNNLMYSTTLEEPFCSKQLGNCGMQGGVAYIYFFFACFILIFVLRNLIIAVILDSFATSASNRAIRKSDAEKFYKTWRMYDPDETLFIAPYDIIHIIRKIPNDSPLTLYDAKAKTRIKNELLFLTSLKLLNIHDKVPMARIIDALCVYAYRVPPPEDFSFMNDQYADVLKGSLNDVKKHYTNVLNLTDTMTKGLKGFGEAALGGLKEVVGPTYKTSKQARGKSSANLKVGAPGTGSMAATAANPGTSSTPDNNSAASHTNTPLMQAEDNNTSFFGLENTSMIDNPYGSRGQLYTPLSSLTASSEEKVLLHKQCAALIIINVVFSRLRERVKKMVNYTRTEREVTERISRQLGIQIEARHVRNNSLPGVGGSEYYIVSPTSTPTSGGSGNTPRGTNRPLLPLAKPAELLLRETDVANNLISDATIERLHRHEQEGFNACAAEFISKGRIAGTIQLQNSSFGHDAHGALNLSNNNSFANNNQATVATAAESRAKNKWIVSLLKDLLRVSPRKYEANFDEFVDLFVSWAEPGKLLYHQWRHIIYWWHALAQMLVNAIDRHIAKQSALAAIEGNSEGSGDKPAAQIPSPADTPEVLAQLSAISKALSVVFPKDFSANESLLKAVKGHNRLVLSLLDRRQRQVATEGTVDETSVLLGDKLSNKYAKLQKALTSQLSTGLESSKTAARGWLTLPKNKEDVEVLFGTIGHVLSPTSAPQLTVHEWLAARLMMSLIDFIGKAGGNATASPPHNNRHHHRHRNQNLNEIFSDEGDSEGDSEPMVAIDSCHLLDLPIIAPLVLEGTPEASNAELCKRIDTLRTATSVSKPSSTSSTSNRKVPVDEVLDKLITKALSRGSKATNKDGATASLLQSFMAQANEKVFTEALAVAAIVKKREAEGAHTSDASNAAQQSLYDGLKSGLEGLFVGSAAIESVSSYFYPQRSSDVEALVRSVPLWRKLLKPYMDNLDPLASNTSASAGDSMATIGPFPFSDRLSKSVLSLRQVRAACELILRRSEQHMATVLHLFVTEVGKWEHTHKALRTEQSSAVGAIIKESTPLITRAVFTTRGQLVSDQMQLKISKDALRVVSMMCLRDAGTGADPASAEEAITHKAVHPPVTAADHALAANSSFTTDNSNALTTDSSRATYATPSGHSVSATYSAILPPLKNLDCQILFMGILGILIGQQTNVASVGSSPSASTDPVALTTSLNKFLGSSAVARVPVGRLLNAVYGFDHLTNPKGPETDAALSQARPIATHLEFSETLQRHQAQVQSIQALATPNTASKKAMGAGGDQANAACCAALHSLIGSLGSVVVLSNTSLDMLVAAEHNDPNASANDDEEKEEEIVVERLVLADSPLQPLVSSSEATRVGSIIDEGLLSDSQGPAPVAKKPQVTLLPPTIQPASAVVETPTAPASSALIVPEPTRDLSNSPTIEEQGPPARRRRRPLTGMGSLLGLEVTDSAVPRDTVSDTDVPVPLPLQEGSPSSTTLASRRQLRPQSGMSLLSLSSTNEANSPSASLIASIQNISNRQQQQRKLQAAEGSPAASPIPDSTTTTTLAAPSRVIEPASSPSTSLFPSLSPSAQAILQMLRGPEGVLLRHQPIRGPPRATSHDDKSFLDRYPFPRSQVVMYPVALRLSKDGQFLELYKRTEPHNPSVSFPIQSINLCRGWSDDASSDGNKTRCYLSAGPVAPSALVDAAIIFLSPNQAAEVGHIICLKDSSSREALGEVLGYLVDGDR